MKWVEVILPLALNQYYSYHVTPELEQRIGIGKRVLVQFGKKRFFTGIIANISNQNTSGYETKPIVDVLDETSSVNPIQLELWKWISDYYICSIGEVFKAATPAGLKLESSTQIVLLQQHSYLNAEYPQLLYALREKESLALQDAYKLLASASAIRIIEKLIDNKIVTTTEAVQRKVKPKTATFLQLHSKLNNQAALNEQLDMLKRAKKQHVALLRFLELTKWQENKPLLKIEKKHFKTAGLVTDAVVKALIDKDILLELALEIDRISDNTEAETIDIHPLNPHQQKAYEQILEQFQHKQTVLLHGITSSGKTEVYFHLMQQVIKQGKQVLYLLPEIAITTQIINRLKRVFGNKVGVYHSKFNDAERVEIWKKTQSKYQIILGVRSSIFLPYNNLGLIVVDEEHESSYKQHSPAPRYHARDMAVLLGILHKCNVLLGSATPSLESYYNAKAGKYGLVELFKRHQEIELPDIELIDLPQARKRRQMNGIFSKRLTELMEETLAANKQVILFQNRRGYSPFMECRTCGWVPKCKHCDVSLTYHLISNKLECHYCGYTEPVYQRCDNCQSTDLNTKGLGTEKIEEEIKIRFPKAKTARMDFDTTRSKMAYQQIIGEFERKNVDILVGTQMISKGLDFEDVKLVGIIYADNMLHFPDFRAYERSFQLMAQVSGRAGRKGERGKVVIQTNDIQNVVIQDVLRNDYHHLFHHQMQERQMFKYPPFFRIVSIMVKHKKRPTTDNAAAQLAQLLRRVFAKRILGPEYPAISRVQNLYQKQILIKLEKSASFEKARHVIMQSINKTQHIEGNASVRFIIDVDPY